MYLVILHKVFYVITKNKTGLNRFQLPVQNVMQIVIIYIFNVVTVGTTSDCWCPDLALIPTKA